MGFDESSTSGLPLRRPEHRRLVAVGSVHPRRTKDARGDTARLFEELGIRLLKIHPPHQAFAANGYLSGDDALGEIYRTAEEHGRPVMIHTGTSIFPGARNRFADPMAVDDVAVDFPRLSIVLAHAGRPLYMETAVFLVRRHPTPLIFRHPSEEALCTCAPDEVSHRCRLGTDFPAPDRVELERRGFLALPLSDEAKRRILFDNGAAVIR